MIGRVASERLVAMTSLIKTLESNLEQDASMVLEAAPWLRFEGLSRALLGCPLSTMALTEASTLGLCIYPSYVSIKNNFIKITWNKEFTGPPVDVRFSAMRNGTQFLQYHKAPSDLWKPINKEILVLLRRLWYEMDCVEEAQAKRKKKQEEEMREAWGSIE